MDLSRRQVVAGIAVRQAHIAADHEGAQARLGEVLGLRDAEPADALHRDGVADALKDGASPITQIVVLDESWVCAPRAGMRGGTLVRQHDVGKDKSRQFRARASQLIAYG